MTGMEKKKKYDRVDGNGVFVVILLCFGLLEDGWSWAC